MTLSGYQQYQTSNVTLSSPTTLIVLLYGELLCCLARAKEAVVSKNIAAKRKNTAKAIRILTLLMTSLDMEKGEEVARNLAMLYEHIARKLLQSGCDLTVSPFDEAIRLLTPLKEAWEAIATSPLATMSPVPLGFTAVVA